MVSYISSSFIVFNDYFFLARFLIIVVGSYWKSDDEGGRVRIRSSFDGTN